MPSQSNKLQVYLEIGTKRVIAGAIEWPGWCRIARDEETARQALFDYAPRYAHTLGATRLGFRAPSNPGDLIVVERLQGNATTDFGAPDMPPASDRKPLAAADLARLEKILHACWRAFDAAVRDAEGKTLAKGPRGGGRELHPIVEHVIGADAAYLSRLGYKFKLRQADESGKKLASIRQAMLEGLAAALRGELPKRGPRGGKIWAPRYFVRRVAWHVLDHAWEIEDRAE